MHLLAYWRIDNYAKDLDDGAGYNFNSRQRRLHSELQLGDNLWLFTVLRNPPRYFLAAKLAVRSKTINPPDYHYGAYRVWGDLGVSRYYKIRPDSAADEAFDLLRGLPLENGSLAVCDRVSLPQHCQSVRGLTPEANVMLEEFAARLALEERASLVADEYDLERKLLVSDSEYQRLLNDDHRGVAPGRREYLLAATRRDRQLVQELNELYAGRCQLCGFDSPLVFGVPSVEAHHIVYLSRGGLDDRSNMVLLCPNHHTVVHRSDATFDYQQLRFHFPNGRTEPLCMNKHLRVAVL